ncbi:MAG: hypothetical protein P8X79_05495, partial [Reinekea sp.]
MACALCRFGVTDSGIGKAGVFMPDAFLTREGGAFCVDFGFQGGGPGTSMAMPANRVKGFALNRINQVARALNLNPHRWLRVRRSKESPFTV